MDHGDEGHWTGSARVGEWEISLETGRIARQADGAVLIRQGDTVVLVTVVAAASAREGIDFFPLTVEYRERFSSAGRFPGGYRKREGRINDHEILSSRLVDRTIRPLFPENFHHEVQVQASLLAYQPGTDPEALAITGASAALQISRIPFLGPVAGLRVVRSPEGAWIALPSDAERDSAVLDLVLSLNSDGLVMMEGEAKEVSEADLVAAIRFA